MDILRTVFGKKIPLKKYKKQKEHFHNLIKQKDKEIEELKKENKLLLKNALKQSQKRNEISDQVEELLEENKQLKEKQEDDKL